MLLFNNVRIQIAAAAFLFILEISYFKWRKLPLLSTKCFTAMMICSIINIIFDFLTVASLVYFDSIPLWLVRLCHQIFIGSLNAIMLAIYLYVDILNGKQRRYSLKKSCIIFGSFGASVLIVIFGELNYFRDAESVYSYGTMAGTVYLIACLYAIMTVNRTIHIARDSIICTKQHYILLTMGIWILIVSIQYHYPRILLSSLGLSLMVFMMYLSFENPKVYINSETKTFNTQAYRLMIQEKTSKNRPFYVLDVVFDDIKEIERNIGQTALNALLTDVAQYLMSTCRTRVFFIHETTFSMLITVADSSRKTLRKNAKCRRGKDTCYNSDKGITEETLNMITDKLAKRFALPWEVYQHNIKLKTHVNLFNFPKDVHSAADIYDMHHYISLQTLPLQDKAESFIHKVDKAFIEHKNRFLLILDMITDAVKNDGFEMYFQPIYNVETDSFASAEALIRLKDTKTAGYISPEEFIPLAEKNNLIMDLSASVFSKVFSFMEEQNVRAHGVEYIEVNLSGVQCIDADLPQQIQTLLEQHNLPPSAINLEITESAAVQSPTMLLQNMNKLRQMGCSFSMDDFGTGYSNLSQMASVHYELIKMDKSLLWPCFDDENKDKENARIILQNIVRMIQKLHTRIVAEGVETEDQVRYLKELGIPYMQGYYFSKPLAANEYISFLHTHQRTNDISKKLSEN